MKKIIIASNNKNKKRELEELLRNFKVKVVGLSDLRMHLPRVIEDGKTFRQNAIKKALTLSRYVEGIILADDSGLAVNALGGKPGIRSSRFARAKATDKENNEKLIKLMEKVPADKRQATFISVVAVAEEGVLLGTSEGRSEGKLVFEPRGKNGFGYDPLFMPKGHRLTFAQLARPVKNRISHRAWALKKARTIIQRYL